MSEGVPAPGLPVFWVSAIATQLFFCVGPEFLGFTLKYMCIEQYTCLARAHPTVHVPAYGVSLQTVPKCQKWQLHDWVPAIWMHTVKYDYAIRV